jgi:hypothetical protein
MRDARVRRLADARLLYRAVSIYKRNWKACVGVYDYEGWNPLWACRIAVNLDKPCEDLPCGLFPLFLLLGIGMAQVLSRWVEADFQLFIVGARCDDH